VQTVARFGAGAECHGVAVDSNANIFIGIRENPISTFDNILVLQAAAQYKATQLPVTVRNLQGLAVTPDGQELYAFSYGRVLSFKEPWADAQEEEFAKVDSSDIQQLLVDGTW
jgi:hypothetical protein